MNIEDHSLDDLIRKAIARVLAEKRERKRLYVIGVEPFDVRCTTFLKKLTPSYDVVVLVPDCWGAERACHIRCMPVLLHPFTAQWANITFR